MCMKAEGKAGCITWCLALCSESVNRRWPRSLPQSGVVFEGVGSLNVPSTVFCLDGAVVYAVRPIESVQLSAANPAGQFQLASNR